MISCKVGVFSAAVTATNEWDIEVFIGYYHKCQKASGFPLITAEVIVKFSDYKIASCSRY